MVSIWILAGITYFLALYWTVGIFLLIFNAYVDSYYVAFLFLFTVPIYFACGLFFVHTNAKDQKGRGYLKLAVVLMLVSIFLTYLWCIYYYTALSDQKEVHTGVGGKDEKGNYSKRSKNSYVFE